MAFIGEMKCNFGTNWHQDYEMHKENLKSKELLESLCKISEKIKPMKTYILKKDTPKSKAGEKLELTKYGYKTESGEFFTLKTVENNPEWFGVKKDFSSNHNTLGEAIVRLGQLYNKDLGWYSIIIENHSEDSFSIHVQKVTY